MNSVLSEHRLIRYSNAPASRPVVAARQFVSDLKEGIDPREDIISNLLRTPRNAIIAAWRGTNQIIPTIADGLHGFKQKYTLNDRTNETFKGTKNSVNKIVTNVRQKRIFGTLSAVLAEATDGPVDDAAHAVLGAPNTVIEPV